MGIREFEAFGFAVDVHDPNADPAEVEAEFGLSVASLDDIAGNAIVVLAVPHREYLDAGWPLVTRLFDQSDRGVVMDLKAKLDRHDCPDWIHLWRP